VTANLGPPLARCQPEDIANIAKLAANRAKQLRVTDEPVTELTHFRWHILTQKLRVEDPMEIPDGWSVTLPLPDYGTVVRDSGTILEKALLVWQP
jgi:hypothetical protein